MSDSADLIFRYFPELSEQQKIQFSQLGQLYPEFNARINLISRKDISHLYERHVLHSLAIAYYMRFPQGSHVADAGTGGGFPGIPLAIFFPQVQFTLIDSIAKKTGAVSVIVGHLELNNIIVLNRRVEEVEEQFDFVVSRATASLSQLIRWVESKISGRYPNSGLICLKGGKIDDEIKKTGRQVTVAAVSQFFKEDFFREKWIVHVPFQ
jgi:16S rRNA (guanine527-N7)-methyltransferase